MQVFMQLASQCWENDFEYTIILKIFSLYSFITQRWCQFIVTALFFIKL